MSPKVTIRTSAQSLSFYADLDTLVSPDFRLEDALPNRFVLQELELFHPDEWWELQVRMHNVARWQDEFTPLHKQTESVLEHVRDMLELVNYIEYHFPELAGSMDLVALRWMIVLHDIGEIGTGDVSLMQQAKFSGVQIKAQEGEYAEAIIKSLKNRTLKHRLLKFYQRYEDRQDKRDLEAEFVKFIDLTQGLIWGSQNVFCKIKRRTIHPDQITLLKIDQEALVNEIGVVSPKRVLAIFETLYDILSKDQPTKASLIARNQLVSVLKDLVEVLEEFRDIKEMQQVIKLLKMHIGETVIQSAPTAHLYETET